MALAKQLRVVEVLAASALASTATYVLTYQVMRAMFAWLSSVTVASTVHFLARWMLVLLLTVTMPRMPLRLFVIMWRAGELSISDFQPWRAQLERTYWTVLAGLVAAPAIPLALRVHWSGKPLLPLLPLAALIHIRKLLALPEPTDPRYRLNAR